MSGGDLVTPTGTVTFEDGSTSIGAMGLSDGPITFTTSSLTAGTHAITAIYGGDNNSQSSTSNSIAQTVTKDSTTTTITASSGPQTIGLPVSFTATVTAVSSSSNADRDGHVPVR